MRVIHYGQIERKERVRESAMEEKERAPPPPPNSTLTRMRILEGGALRRRRPPLIQVKIDFFPLP